MKNTFEVPRIPNPENARRAPIEIIGTDIEKPHSLEVRFEYAQSLLPEVPISGRKSKPNSSTGTKNGLFMATKGNDGAVESTSVFGKSGFNFYLLYALSLHLSANLRPEGVEVPPKTHNHIAGHLRKLVDDEHGNLEPEKTFDDLYADVALAVGVENVSATQLMFQDLLTVAARMSDLRTEIVANS